MRDFKYLFAYTIPISVLLNIEFRGAFSFTTFLYAYGIIPLFELIIKPNNSSESEDRELSGFKNLLFDIMLYMNLPIVFFTLGYGFLVLNSESMYLYEQIGIIFSLAILLATNGINVAHELGHRKSLIEKVFSKTLLMFSLYMHFFIEHNLGHHKNVGTSLDPASAKLNQNLYHFWFTSTIGQYKNAWEIQLKKLSGNNFFSINNQLLIYSFIQIGYLFLLFLIWGLSGVFYGVAVAVISFLMLETINYIEHYGLRRRKLSSGRFERVNPSHSWNSNHKIGRIVLYELTRHSDHHYKSSKKYQHLENIIESPQLPYGYPASMLLASVPFLWFSIMNKHIEKYNSSLS